jgi:hypothetical protein
LSLWMMQDPRREPDVDGAISAAKEQEAKDPWLDEVEWTRRGRQTSAKRAQMPRLLPNLRGWVA